MELLNDIFLKKNINTDLHYKILGYVIFPVQKRWHLIRNRRAYDVSAKYTKKFKFENYIFELYVFSHNDSRRKVAKWCAKFIDYRDWSPLNNNELIGEEHDDVELLDIGIFEIGWNYYQGIPRVINNYRYNFTQHTEKEAIEAMQKFVNTHNTAIYAHNVAIYGTVYN